MKVKSNKLIGDETHPVNYVDTKKKSGKITPEYLVIHYTASDNFDGDVRTLSTANVQASCQLVIGPNGEITQIGKLDDKLWHAGRSKWRNRVGLNSYAIGIEVTSPGPVDLIKDEGHIKRFKTWYGKIINEGADPKWNFVYAAHKNGGPKRWWAGYTKAQIEVLTELVPLLVEAYNIKEVVGHDDIAPGRKQDPGPCCPDSLWAIFNGRKEDNVAETDVVSGKHYEIFVSGNQRLNVRDEPSGKIIGSFPTGTIVDFIKEQDGWYYIQSPNGNRGWIYSKYAVEAA